MYQIFADDNCIYDDKIPYADNNVLEPKLEMEQSCAGKLSFKMQPAHYAYQLIERLKTDITVKKNGDVLWTGRVINESDDFLNNRNFECEGSLAFLNDVSQPPHEFTNASVYSYIDSVLSVYNSVMPISRKFMRGAITHAQTISITKTTNYEKTLESLNWLVNEYGGFFQVRYVSGNMFLDYLGSYTHTSTQEIRFGENLLDFTKSFDCNEFATVILPLGARITNTEGDDENQNISIDERVTIKSVNEGSPYLISAARNTYGWIEKVVTFDDVEDPSVLKSYGLSYLSDAQFEKMEIEITALDMKYLSADMSSINLLDNVRAVSKPHGMDHIFPVQKMTIPFDHPENATVTLGNALKNSLTNVNNKINTDLVEKIRQLPSETSILDAALFNANVILNQATTGYVTITHNNDGTDAIYISDQRGYEPGDNANVWRWNMNGLAFSNNGGLTWTGPCITNDGGIVGTYIVGGSISGDKITAHSITTDQISSTYTNAINNAISTLSNDIDGLTLTYQTNGDMAGILKLNRNGVQVISDVSINMTGAVTFTSLETAGASIINGDNITTGSIKGRNIYLNRTDDLDPSAIYFEHGGSPYAMFRLDNNGAGTEVESTSRLYLQTMDTNTSIKIESSAGTSIVANRIYEQGKRYITLESGGFYDNYTWVPGAINIGNYSTHTQASSNQCQINLWGNVNVNGYPIGTARFG